jgi:hypothetical protein
MPPARTAHLIVVKHVDNHIGGSFSASDFTLHVDGNNPSPADLPGSESGIDVH